MSHPVTIAYSPGYLEWTGSASDPIRAKHALDRITARSASIGVPVTLLTPVLDWDAALPLLAEIHDPGYVGRVHRGETGESGYGVRQGEIASIMFQGTVDLVHAIESDGFASRVYFNPQGAKHHAQFDASSGFCVFNDMAWAAHHFVASGRRVAYLDWDIHHGDGTEDLTRDSSDILTASIHEWGIFPWTGHDSDPDRQVYNWPLPRRAGDEELLHAMAEAIAHIEEFRPDVLLLACGADGLAADRFSSAQYTLDGIARAAELFGELAGRLGVPVLIGGAGGYRPHDETPEAWAITVIGVNDALETGTAARSAAEARAKRAAYARAYRARMSDDQRARARETAAVRQAEWRERNPEKATDFAKASSRSRMERYRTDAEFRAEYRAKQRAYAARKATARAATNDSAKAR